MRLEPGSFVRSQSVVSATIVTTTALGTIAGARLHPTTTQLD